MDQLTHDLTRRALHGIAELVLAGPQYATSQDIRLRVVSGGMGTVAAPDLRVVGATLMGSGARTALKGTIAELAARVGVAPRDLRDVYAGGPDVAVDEPLIVDDVAAAEIFACFGRGEAALRALAPAETPVLWPEHFDIGVSLGEVNYGVSPGDANIGVPYAYVGPWAPREGAFWNMPFGAARPMSQMPDADSVEQFFRKGAKHAKADPVRPT